MATMENKNPYNPDACCGADCYAFGLNAGESCWGDVHVAAEVWDGEDGIWVHECEGHSGCFEDGEKFKPQPAAQPANQPTTPSSAA